MQCQNEAIADSPVSLAADLRGKLPRCSLPVSRMMTFATTWWRATRFHPVQAAGVIENHLVVVGAGDIVVDRCSYRCESHAATRRAGRPGQRACRRGRPLLMITFVLLAAVLTIAGVALIAVPLLKKKPVEYSPAMGGADSHGILAIGSAVLYIRLTNWSLADHNGDDSPQTMVAGWRASWRRIHRTWRVGCCSAAPIRSCRNSNSPPGLPARGPARRRQEHGSIDWEAEALARGDGPSWTAARGVSSSRRWRWTRAPGRLCSSCCRCNAPRRAAAGP